MKWIKSFTIICFCLVLIIPIVTFNTRPDVVSEIDNRKLSENPFASSSEDDLTKKIESYVNDRIGLRDQMILGYTVLNDFLFGKMVHPSYTYGKDGYVFGEGFKNITYGEYHEVFADAVKKMQDYCEDRDIPFLMVFSPAKPAVLTEYISDGIYYDREWVNSLMVALEERGVNYLDNTKILREKHLAGEAVFNKKYDANHWNDIGAYYGTTEALSILQKDIPTIHVTTKDEMTVSQTLQDTLPVSKFPIQEYVPSVSIATPYEEVSEKFADEIELHPSYKSFGCFVNEERQSEGAPKALVFQGSYMNKLGFKYLVNAFSEYTFVHDYQNTLDFDYYFNIFKPDCVIFEVAEYTVDDSHFSYDKMLNMQLNKPLTDIESEVALTEKNVIGEEGLAIEEGQTLTTVTWNTDQAFKSVWLSATKEYDFRKCENGYEITLLTEDYQKIKSEFEIVALNDTGDKLIYITVEHTNK